MKTQSILIKLTSALILFFRLTTLSAQVTPSTGGVPAAVKVTATPAGYYTDYPVNYVRSFMPVQPMTSESAVLSAGYMQVQQQTQYADGLGRPLQTVTRRGGGGAAALDLVKPVLYDGFGRETYQYLPYAGGTNGAFKVDPFNQQAAFYGAYASSQPALAGEQVLYSKTEFENSPLNRPVKTMAPGNSWGGNSIGVGISYETNSTGEVRSWDIGVGEAAIPISTGYYGDATLYRTVTTDEHGKRVVEYKDKEGRVVLKKVEIKHDGAAGITVHEGWLCTYYVYDELGQLRFVVPPLGVEALLKPTANWNISAAGIADELCFRYVYDSLNRMIAKKVPGAAWVYMVYDLRDRLVFTQDGNMRAKQWWLSTLYDAFNRPVQTGMLTLNITRADLQIHVNSLTDQVQANTQAGTHAGTPADLYVSEHDGRTVYKATNSIVFEANMRGENFEATIIPADGIVFTGIQDISMNPLPSGGTFIPLTFTYYDGYGWTNKSYTSTYNNKLGQGNNVYGEPLPSTASSMVRTLVTGTRVRVIEDANDLSKGTWLETVNYYDDKGNVIQVQADNYKGGTDISIARHDFTGKNISTYQVHNNPSGNIINSRVYTELDYDHAGRLVEIRKTMNDDAATARIVAHNSYDELGQLKTKQLGQQTDAANMPATGFLETQDYAYNIRGWLKGLNWEGYASASGIATKSIANRWFAMDLSYDWGYSKNQLNGNIAGMRWQTAGDQHERSFGYDYDAANRLLSADFKQYNSGVWNNDLGGGRKLDFSVKMGNEGKNDGTAYDANGNIKRMQQWGLQAGGSSDKIDDLVYQYYGYGNSNKLSHVTDAITTPQQLGDFTDKNTDGADYGYDVNGNLLTDKNKGIAGSTGLDLTSGGAISYNHLNLPWQIMMKDDNGQNKGVITYIYDAAGNKLEKRVEEFATSANNNIAKHTNTTYLGGYVYEGNVLKFLGHEEGRARVRRDTDGAVKGYAYDYFLKDHLGNIRMVLTDEHQTDAYPVASLEDATIANERLYYDIPNGGRVQKNTVPDYPADSYTSPNDWIQRLNGNAQKVGTGMVLKVMSGDKVNIHANSWYRLNGANPGSPAGLQVADLLTSLVGGIAGAGSGGHAATQLQSNGNLSSGVGRFLTESANNYATNGNKPKAYLNYVLFDEQFNIVWTGDGRNSGLSQVGSNEVFTSHDVVGREMKKSGYLYIYVSNETPNIDVFFDNLQVTHERGALTEETHYYPFGLTMKGISSKSAGKLENRYRFNDGTELENEEFVDGTGLELYASEFRMYDPQIGRFNSVEPLASYFEEITPYSYCINNPISFNDPFGLNPTDGFPGQKPNDLPNVTVVGKIKRNRESADDIRIVLTQINPSGNKQRIAQVSNVLSMHMIDFGLTTKLRQAHFYAQISHETDGFNIVTESYKYSRERILEIFPKYFNQDNVDDYVRSPRLFDRTYADRMGNGNEGSQDGSQYRGRGALQLTGRESYAGFTRWYQQKYNDRSVNFVTNPELISSNMKYFVLSSLWEYGVDKRGINIFADQDNILKVTQIINGGRNGLLDRKARLKRAKIALGILP